METKQNNAWHCVLDRNMRMLYLGTDRAAATSLTGERCVVGSGATRGNAQRFAAIAAGVAVTSERAGRGAKQPPR